MRTPQEQEEWELQALGCTKKQLLEANSLYKDDPLMLAMAILSDVQEVAQQTAESMPTKWVHDQMERIRLFSNRAKMLIDDERRKARN